MAFLQTYPKSEGSLPNTVVIIRSHANEKAPQFQRQLVDHLNKVQGIPNFVEERAIHGIESRGIKVQQERLAGNFKKYHQQTFLAAADAVFHLEDLLIRATAIQREFGSNGKETFVLELHVGNYQSVDDLRQENNLHRYSLNGSQLTVSPFVEHSKSLVDLFITGFDSEKVQAGLYFKLMEDIGALCGFDIWETKDNLRKLLGNLKGAAKQILSLELPGFPVADESRQNFKLYFSKKDGDEHILLAPVSNFELFYFATDRQAYPVLPKDLLSVTSHLVVPFSVKPFKLD